jgi:hypothetical protein
MQTSFKRAFTSAVAAATILWSVGFASFVAPLTASAAVAGDLIKGPTLSTVYYYASNGQRYSFPNEKTYFSWYTDFSAVQTISDAALAAIPLAGNIVYRPGSRWIKIQSDPKTYAVTPQGHIRWIETEGVASGFAGSAWNTFIDDVPDVFFVDYTVGPSLTSASLGYNGMLVNQSGTTYLLWNGMKREVTAACMSGNRFQSRFVLPGPGVNLASIPTGTTCTGAEAALLDTAQLGAAVTGGLSFSLASDTPASATVPAGASSVPFTKFRVMSTSGTASISSIAVTLGGVGASSNIDQAYLYDGATRLTDGRSVNSSTRKATFGGLTLNFGSGETKFLMVRADIATVVNGGDTANFGIASAADVTSTATVSGSFPVVGNTMSFSSTLAGTIIVDKQGSIANPTIGQEGAIIGRFSLEAQTEDASVRRITLNVDDASDHSNFKLWNGTTLLANGTVSGDLVTFELTNVLLVAEGDTENLSVSADIGGQAGDEIHVAVEEEADVYAIGGDFGFNMAVDITGYDATGSACASSADDCSFSEIEGGELTFAFNGPPSGDIQIDGKDQVIMKFTVTAQNWTEIRELNITIDCTSEADCDADLDDDGGLITDSPDEAALRDIALRRSDGSIWMGPEEYSTTVAANDLSVDLVFDDNQVLTAGQSVDIMLTADVDNDAVEGTEIQATLHLGGAGDVVAEDQNGDDLGTGDIVPGTDMVGNTMTLTTSSLNVTISSPPSSGTFVKGSSGVAVVGYAFDAGDTSDIMVTDLTIRAAGDTDGTLTAGVNEDDVEVRDHVSSCSLYDGLTGALVDGPESLDDLDAADTTSGAEVLFENFSWTVSAGESEKLVVKCNFSNNDVQDANSDVYSFFIEADADVVAEDADGDNVDATVDESSLATASEVPAITIINSGSLTASLDGSTPSSTIILGNSTGIATSAFRFQATDESFIVTDLTLVNCLEYNADFDCVDLGETDGQDDVSAAVKITYKNQAGATVTKTGFLADSHVVFSSLDLWVASSGTSIVTVTIDTNAVSSVAAASGDQIQLNLVDSDASFDQETGADFVTEFEAVGASSGETVTTFGVNGIAANNMVLRKTKPTISLAAGSPSGAGVPGLSEVLRFNVSADSRGFVSLDLVTFKVTASDFDGDWSICATIDDPTLWEFYDASDPSEKLDDDGDWSFFEADGSTCAVGAIRYAELDMAADTTTPAEEISAGQTKTYVVRLDTTGANPGDDDAVRLDIPDETEMNNVTTPLDAINWRDDVETVGNVCDRGSETLCIDGAFVKNLPVTGGTIVY